MGGLSYFVKISLFLFVMSVMMLFLVDRNTMEFKVTMLSAGISGVVGILCIVIGKYREKKI